MYHGTHRLETSWYGMRSSEHNAPDGRDLLLPPPLLLWYLKAGTRRSRSRQVELHESSSLTWNPASYSKMPGHKLHEEKRQAYAPVSVDPDEPQLCCICLDACCTPTRDKDAQVPVQLPCGHVFGDACITKWMQSKQTCPLCRFELFDIEFDDGDDEHDLWMRIVERDSAIQRFGTSSGYTSTFSFVPHFPREQIASSELDFSAARSSTAAHRSLDARLGGFLSGPPQYARQPYRARAQTGCRYGHGKSSTSYCESEDVWITALIDERYELAVTGVGDGGWIMALNDNEDEGDELSVQQAWQEDLPPDSMFDDLLAEHMRWMHELDEPQYDVYDEFDYLV